jgi:aryl-alcohol dehydrogenase-like predicted oxidoreductase
MEMRPLGTTGVQVSSLCLGTMTFGQQNTEAEAHAQLDYAVAHGINFIDTAEMYPIPPKPETASATERFIGSWLAARGGRDRIVIATKAVGRGSYTWLRGGVVAETNLSKAQLTQALEGSLARLRTDYVDLYQLHWPDRPVSQWGANPTSFRPPAPGPEVPIEETLETLHGFVKAGKVRFVGLSNESAWGAMRFLDIAHRTGAPRVQSIQNAYNLLNRTFEVGLAEIALRERVGLLAYAPLAAGFLTGKYRGGAVPPGTRKALFDRVQRYERPGAAEAVEDYLAVAARFGLDPAHLAIAFVTSRPFVTSAILGATSMEQLRTDVAAAQVRLPDEAVAAVDAVHQLRSNPCP